MIRRLAALMLAALPVMAFAVPSTAQTPLPPQTTAPEPLPPLPPAAQAPDLPEPPPDLPPGAPGAAMPAPAQFGGPPPPAPSQDLGQDQGQAGGGRVFCEQNVAFHLADRETVPERYRRFLGIWSDAAWDPKTCAALIVENVTADGTASIRYVVGPMGPDIKGSGGVLHGTGIIRDGTLRFQNSDGSQYAFRPDVVDLDGTYTTPQGQTLQAIFKQTP